MKFPINQVGREPVEDYSSAHVILPTIWIPLEKDAKMRCPMPENVLKLLQMWRQGATASLLQFEWNLCGLDGALVSCPICLMTFHKTCSRGLVVANSK